MKLHPPFSFHLDREQLRHGPERWADITLHGWQLLFDPRERRQVWREWHSQRPKAWQLIGHFLCWLSGTLVLMALAYLLYLASRLR
ncbi:hypothetical protein [Chromobacterium sp. IIBBL 290-4]|uniref:hypothetical protein n=1 Tax=Chromobacterium sp. IIBBL 290-4 TaxID=2953890 RepID=UPI0020B87447|nr:hypothetical protein [Chromobacterium sp. IIBBL 290-4]UTH75053.1 hypothetical protein NKT35_02825 [Chromobacterium sp. IIBBL 290-4]